MYAFWVLVSYCLLIVACCALLVACCEASGLPHTERLTQFSLQMTRLPAKLTGLRAFVDCCFVLPVPFLRECFAMLEFEKNTGLELR